MICVVQLLRSHATSHTLLLFYIRAYARKNYATVEIHLELACVAGGIISASEVLEENCEAFRRMGSIRFESFSRHGGFVGKSLIRAKQSGGPGFESRSGHLLDLFSVVPSSNPRPRL